MNKIERTYLFVVLAFIAIALAILAFGASRPPRPARPASPNTNASPDSSPRPLTK